ncbi:Bax inhibitor-1/YccA family protein [Treponema lecithinolyticum]|jgi:Integral membrane protein, interacts with FtsH|uniref:Bax inhibitor-1/YccA family protein n=1 Tax=Treponema lecithinolyticum ATCC 700332 TaxID=1321815 RepID=A0ABN0P1J5_TRELE|nr:Bax inhibitor-1/YccA family protein [Treponema lecithinolyticum]ERJ94385.1 hypothetical protein HMPREF9193_00357 [Treponema lecithinolyticum ATCC 700332]
MDNSTQTISLKQANEDVRRKFISGVYGWMVLALAISGAAAFVTAHSTFMLRLIFGNPIVFFALIIGEFALVFWLSAGIRKMSSTTAFTAFIAYSVFNGITLSAIFLQYTPNAVAKVFVVSALMFGGMSLYGVKTKSDLRSAGRYLLMGLIGIIIASVLNLLLRSSSLDWIISILAVVVFTGLTAYDTQKLMNISVYADGSDNFKKIAVIGALELYLDFINIFLSLLRLFGKRR